MERQIQTILDSFDVSAPTAIPTQR
jgi:hypothetical protein